MGSHGGVSSSRKVITVVKSISGGARVPECSIRGGGEEIEREKYIYVVVVSIDFQEQYSFLY